MSPRSSVGAASGEAVPGLCGCQVVVGRAGGEATMVTAVQEGDRVIVFCRRAAHPLLAWVYGLNAGACVCLRGEGE